MNTDPAKPMNISNKHTPKIVKPSMQIMKRKQTIQRLRPKNPPTPQPKNLNSPNKRPQTQQKQRTEKLDSDSHIFVSGHSSFCKQNENSKPFPKQPIEQDSIPLIISQKFRRNTVTSQPSFGNLTSRKSFKERQKTPTPTHETKKEPIQRLLNIYQKTQEKITYGNLLRNAKSKEDLAKISQKRNTTTQIEKSSVKHSFKEIVRPLTEHPKPKSSANLVSPLNLWNVPFSSLFDQVSQDGFQIVKTLGHGSFAIVKLVNDLSSGEIYALKSYEKYKLTDSHKMNNVRREILILRKINHENIVKLKFAFEDTRKIHLVQEFVSELSLHAYLKSKPNRKLDESEAKRLFRQIVRGIHYCHSKNIVHRDIKLENILLDRNNNAKIIDFGFSIVMPSYKKLNIFCGTPSYMSPEIISRNYSGQSADIWALGVLLYVMMNGKFPFKASNDNELFRKISKGTFTFGENISAGAQNLINGILKTKASERFSTEQIIDDEWLNS